MTALERFHRAIRGATQSEFAEQAGISRPYANDVWHGRRRLTAKLLAGIPKGREILRQQALEEADLEWARLTR